MIDLRFIAGKQATRVWKHFRDTVTVRGVEIPIENAPYNSVYRMTRDMYENTEADLLEEVVEPDVPVIELGGCFGFISVLTGRMLDEGVEHVVVEPVKSNIEILKETRELNNADFDIVEKAYSTVHDGGVSLTRDVERNPMTFRINGGGGEIDTTYLAELHELVGGEEFTLISDMETSEQDLLTNEMDLLEEYCRYMHIEFDELENADFGPGELEKETVFGVVGSKGKVFVFRNSNLVN